MTPPSNVVHELSTLLSPEAVVGPDNASYDKLRRVWNAMIDRMPAAIALPADAHKVAEVVRLASRNGLPLTVRCGGNSRKDRAERALKESLRCQIDGKRVIVAYPAGRPAFYSEPATAEPIRPRRMTLRFNGSASFVVPASFWVRAKISLTTRRMLPRFENHRNGGR